MPEGHPRHQMRTFTVKVRGRNQHPITLPIEAQTEHDALLRAGIRLVAFPRGTCDPADWIVTLVTDPAPLIYTPLDVVMRIPHKD